MTKAALETLVLTYAAECAGTNVKVTLYNPGPARTAMRAKAFPGEDPMTLPAPEDLAPEIVARGVLEKDLARDRARLREDDEQKVERPHRRSSTALTCRAVTSTPATICWKFESCGATSSAAFTIMHPLC